jgi:plasmid replication initiation protein
MVQVENSLIVRMANDFAQQAPYQLNTRTHYLFWHFLTHIDPFSKKVDDVVIPIRDIRNLLIANSGGNESTTHWGNFKEEVEKCVAELKSYVVLRPSESGVEEDGQVVNEPVSIFRDITAVRENEGPASYKFRVDPKMEGSLFALAHKYVSFQLLKDVRVSNKYACRLYPALKSRADSQKKYKDIPIFELTIDELRTLLVLGDKKYTKSYDLKRYVIEAAVDDINENSDIRVWPTYINKGRKLVGVRFNISASKYNYSQLALSLAEKDDKYLKYLKRTIKKKYSELDLKEFIAIYPDQFPIIQKAAEAEWKKYEDDFGDSIKAVSATVLADWLDGTVRTYVKDFLKGEWEMSEKVG